MAKRVRLLNALDAWNRAGGVSIRSTRSLIGC